MIRKMVDNTEIPANGVIVESELKAGAASTEAAPDSSNATSFIDQMINKSKQIPKQEYKDIPTEPEPEPVESQAGQSDQSGSSSNSSASNGDRLLKEAKAHVMMFDFLASRALGMWSDEKSDQYAATASEKDELANALAEYYATLSEPPKMPPWLFVVVVVVMVYGPKFNTARKIRKSKKSDQNKTAAATEEKKDRWSEAVPFKVVTDDQKQKTDSPVVESK